MPKFKQTLNVPAGAQQSPWDDYGRRRRLVWIAFGGFLPVCGSFGAFFNWLDWQPGSAVIVPVIAASWMAFLAISIFRMTSFRCPRCGETFFIDGYTHSQLNKRCLHCDLPKWADPPYVFTPANISQPYDQTHATQLPTQSEINLYDSMEEQYAVKNFHGKNIEEAESLFRDNFLGYKQELMSMGPKAFRFYLPAAVNYLLGPHSDEDSDAASSFCALIENCLKEQPGKLDERTVAIMKNAVAEILKNFDRYDCHVDTYGDVPKRYQAILSRFGNN